MNYMLLEGALTRAFLSGEITCPTGRCAGCGRHYQADERPAYQGMLIEPQGVAIYTICWECGPRLRSKKFRRWLERQAYRTIFGAGPDNVGGES